MKKADELELIKSVENDEWNPVDHLNDYKKRFLKAAAETSAKDFRMNIRLSSSDVEVIKAQALRDGIPYQTLIASILHKYAHGRLVESV